MAHPFIVLWVSSNRSSTHRSCDLGCGAPAIPLQPRVKTNAHTLVRPVPILQHLNKGKRLVWWAKALM